MDEPIDAAESEQRSPIPTFPDFVRSVREGKNWSKADLARESGLSRSYVNQIEDGSKKDPSARTVGILCQTLGVHIIEMMQVLGALPPEYHEQQINSDLELAMHLRRQRDLSEEFVNTLVQLIHLAELDELGKPLDEAAPSPLSEPHEQT